MKNCLVLVFELATDAHIPKDVIQVPLTLCKKLNLDFVLITRPSIAQKSLKGVCTFIAFGKESQYNNNLYLHNRNEGLSYDKEWYKEACSYASEYGSVLMLFPHFGDPVKGSWLFYLNNLKRLKRSYVYLKMDIDPNKQRKWTSSKNQIKSLVKKIYGYFNYFPIDYISYENKKARELVTSRFEGFGGEIALVKNCPDNLALFERESNLVKHKTFLSVGRIGTRQKATEILLQSWMEISTQIPDWNLLLVGSCEHSFKLEWQERLKEKNIEHTVRWRDDIKNRTELASIYQQSAVLVISSRHESGPLILFEGIASSCSVISTPVGEVSELLSSDDKGLFEIDNHLELKDRLLFFAQNPEYRRMQSAYLKEKIKNRNWEHELDGLCNDIKRKLFS